MPRFSEPFSVPDPDAEAWDAMLAENRMLQAANGTLAGANTTPDATVYRLDQLGEAQQAAQRPETIGGAPAVDLPSAATEAAKRARALENGGAAVGGLIAQAEGTAGPDAYDKFYGKGWKRDVWYPPNTKPPSQLTVDEWIQLGPQLHKANGYGAMGKYQIMADALKGGPHAAGLKSQLGLTGNEVMSDALQDRMMRELLSEAGYDKFLAGKIDAATLQRNMASIWDSLPADDSGLTRHGQPARLDSKTLRDALAAAQATAQAATNRRIEEGYLPTPVGGWREDRPSAQR